MNRYVYIVLFLSILALKSEAQENILLVSDTQKPMWIEKLFLKYNQNEKATRLIFEQIKIQRPTNLFILGDVVNWGPRKERWDTISAYITACREQSIQVSALMGNHDVMGSVQKGEQQFQLHFPDHVRTGYIQVVDSIAFVLLNSNFKKLTQTDIDFQNRWLSTSLQMLDHDPSIQVTVVACHHAPYTNSKTVGPSLEVQKNFVPLFLASSKAKLFVTGHAHAFEHFNIEGKDFLTIGGGGGIHQPLRTSPFLYKDFAAGYKPMFHFLGISRINYKLTITSHQLSEDFTGFKKGYTFMIESERVVK